MNGPRLAYARPGPNIRGVTLLKLPALHGGVWVPQPTMQHGGILPYPRGTVLRIDIGSAGRCLAEIAQLVAGALRTCKDIEVVGTDPYGVADTVNELGRALAEVHARGGAATC